MTAPCGHIVTVLWLTSFLYHLKSRGIPEVLCISACIFPLSPEINFGKLRILCSPGNLPLLSSPYHSTHSFSIISLGTDRTNSISCLWSPFMSALSRIPGLRAHSWFFELIKCIYMCPWFWLVFQLLNSRILWNSIFIKITYICNLFSESPFIFLSNQSIVLSLESTLPIYLKQ